MNVKNVCILGATGSIGLNTLDVIARHSEKFKPYVLTANRNAEEMLALCKQYRPRYAVMAAESAAQDLHQLVQASQLEVEVLGGPGALIDVAALDEVDIVMAAIVGAAGLRPNLAAARAGKKVLLANKESLVMSGELFMKEVRDTQAQLLPIDSEHNAIFQCLPTGYQCGEGIAADIRRILLTASGGPFRNFDAAALKAVTPAQACRHPNWSMGQKISVDSASLMNKGLELIEACWLFDVRPDDIEVHIHPESIIHSMVEYTDGSVLAQMGNPDMRTPIAYGLGWPERLESGVASLNLFELASLNFERPDDQRFPCLELARQAFKAGGTACASLNAANEEAVAAFLKGNIPFTSIPDIIDGVLGGTAVRPVNCVEDVLSADQSARCEANRLISGLTTI